MYTNIQILYFLATLKSDIDQCQQKLKSQTYMLSVLTKKKKKQWKTSLL